MRACLAGSGVGVSPSVFIWWLLDAAVLRIYLSFIVLAGRFVWLGHLIVPASVFMIYWESLSWPLQASSEVR